MEDLTKDTETVSEDEQVENQCEPNSRRSSETTTSRSTSVLSNDSLITIESAEDDYDSTETSDGSVSGPPRICNLRAAAHTQGMSSLSSDDFDPISLMEEGRIGNSPLQELGAAELTARALNYPDVIFESVSDRESSSRSSTAAQPQVAYLWPELLNGKFFTVEKTSLKMLIAGTYQFGPVLGAGAYSWVLEGVNLNSGEAVAVKISNGTVEANEHMDNEISILKRVADNGFPSCMWFGTQGKQRILIMDKFGPSMTKLLVPCNGTFTLKTTLMIADQCVAKLQKLHGFGLTHCDVKPDNIVMGWQELRCNEVFLIDYGLAKAPNRSNNYAGDILYASLNVHRGGVLGPMDDLESLGYALLFMQMGRLPWSHLVTLGLEDSELYKQIHAMKRQMSVGSLQEYPSWFMKYMRYCVWTSGPPDYKKIRRLFQDEMNQNQFTFDCQYDWVLFKYVNRYVCR